MTVNCYWSSSQPVNAKYMKVTYGSCVWWVKMEDTHCIWPGIMDTFVDWISLYLYVAFAFHQLTPVIDT